MKYETHPAAEIFPLMTDEEFSGLVEDIKEHGLIEPIILYEDMILDGRNRIRACEQLGIEPRFEVWPNSEPPEAYVVSKNLHRRHLNESQRAMIAARIANMKRGDAASQRSDVDISTSVPEAAEMLNIDRSTVYHARTVQQDGMPEEIAAVETGHVPVTTMAKKIRARKKGLPDPTNKRPGPNLQVPDGMTLEMVFRQGLEHEAGGASIGDICRDLRLTEQSYRMGRDIVLLADKADLGESDAALVQEVLTAMNESQRVSHIYSRIKPIIDRLYGDRGHRSDKTVARRTEDFERAFGHVIQVGIDADKIEIPHISEERAKRALRDLNKALRNMRALKTKLEELYS